MLTSQVRPLGEQYPFGIRLAGLTLAQAQDPAVRAELEHLLVRHGMIVFEDIEQSDAMQVAVSTCFGPLKDHPVKAVARVDNDRMPGVIEIRSTPGNGVLDVEGRRVSHWQPWHFDHCYNNELNRAGVLRAVEIVEEGGITGFLDGIALYEALPADLRSRIEGKEVLYALKTQYDELRFGRPGHYEMIEAKPITQSFLDQAATMSRAIHPAVWTRPTGEKCLHVSSYMAQGLLGDENAEGDALLEEVCQQINALAQTCSYQHKWRPTDMVAWDNTRMLHKVSGHDPQDTRLLYRTTIAGDYGLGRWETAPADEQQIEAMA